MANNNNRRRGTGGSQPKSGGGGGQYPKSRGRADEVKHVEFGVGKVSDAANFKKNRITLARHIGTQSFEGAMEASHALEYGIAPVAVEPTMPNLPQKKKVTAGTKDDGTVEQKVEVMDDDDYDYAKAVYKREWFNFERQMKE
jgi:hypothetical protein